jgi:hypothetical protein
MPIRPLMLSSTLIACNIELKYRIWNIGFQWRNENLPCQLLRLSEIIGTCSGICVCMWFVNESFLTTWIVADYQLNQNISSLAYRSDRDNGDICICRKGLDRWTYCIKQNKLNVLNRSIVVIVMSRKL